MNNTEAKLITTFEDDYVVKSLMINGVIEQQIKYHAESKTTIIITISDYTYTESVYSADNELIYFNKLDKVKASTVEYIKPLETEGIKMIA